MPKIVDIKSRPILFIYSGANISLNNYFHKLNTY